MSQPINIIVEGFLNAIATEIFQKAFQPFSIGYCATLSKSDIYTPDLGTEEQAWRSYNYPEHIEDWHDILPLDEELIECMRACETVVLHMQSRWEEKGKVISYQQRKRKYYQHLRYWNHVLETKHIDLLILSNIPHVAATFVLYSLCKLKNIPLIAFRPDGIVRDSLFFAEDWEYPGAELQDAHERIQEQYQNTEVPLSEEMEQYYREQTANKEANHWYMQKDFVQEYWPGRLGLGLRIFRRSPEKFLRFLGSLCARIFTPHFWLDEFRNLREQLRWQSMRRLYRTHAREPDISLRYIYVPLHYQPECTTCPIAGAFADQELMVQLLAACIPEDILLYVKEHPLQRGTCRNKNFYKDLLAIPQVQFVPTSYSSQRLLKHCVAVATATGTAGLEGLFQGKPVILFGHRFYQYAKGVFRVRTKKECENAVTSIFSKSANPSSHDMRCFLKAYEEVAMRGYISTAWQQKSDKKQVDTIAHKLSERMREKLNASS